jgi:hypothetical protein
MDVAYDKGINIAYAFTSKEGSRIPSGTSAGLRRAVFL